MLDMLTLYYCHLLEFQKAFCCLLPLLSHHSTYACAVTKFFLNDGFLLLFLNEQKEIVIMLLIITTSLVDVDVGVLLFNFVYACAYHVS